MVRPKSFASCEDRTPEQLRVARRLAEGERRSDGRRNEEDCGGGAGIACCLVLAVAGVSGVARIAGGAGLAGVVGAAGADASDPQGESGSLPVATTQMTFVDTSRPTPPWSGSSM